MLLFDGSLPPDATGGNKCLDPDVSHMCVAMSIRIFILPSFVLQQTSAGPLSPSNGTYFNFILFSLLQMLIIYLRHFNFPPEV